MPLLCLLLVLAGLVYNGCKKKDLVDVPVSSIIKVSDTLVRVGDTITITGSNFSTTPGKNLVSIASIALRVIKSTSTVLTAVIPPSAQSGQLTIAYPGGRSVSYPGIIHIIVSGQPVITSITPANAQPGDTILVHGSNFGSPYTKNGLAIEGLVVPLYNVSDTLVKAILPNNAVTGMAIMTTDGLSSAPYHITVIQQNPLTDGRLYWALSTRLIEYDPTSTGLNLMRGNDQNSSPYCSVLAPLDVNDITQANYGPTMPFFIFNSFSDQTYYPVSNIVTDANGNSYYIYNSTDGANTFTLVKISVKPTYKRTPVWTHTFTADEVGVTTYTDPIYGGVFDIPNYPMSRLSIDGNKIYVKLGLSNKFYVGDVSGGTFKPTLQHYPLPDNDAYALEFGKNYIFYGTVTTNQLYSPGLPDGIGTIHYIPRGGGASKSIPIDPGQFIVTYMTDPTHNDNLLIYTVAPSAANAYEATLYKFNAATGALVKLFDKSNWVDAVSPFNPNAGLPIDLNLGLLWVNNHIYYINGNHMLNGKPNLAMYRLNDDGSGRVLNIYVNIDITSPNDYTKNSYIPIFIDKTQAKP